MTSSTPEHPSHKFSIGIDLGTTHSVLSYIEPPLNELDEPTQNILAIPQLTAAGEIENKTQLPSFIYQAHSAELAKGATVLPWTAEPKHLVGEIARNRGRKTPLRLVSSAKSWLCHTGIDCKAPLLPTETQDEVERISPFDASVAYLQHLTDAWDHQFPGNPLNQQDLTITVPASFDPAARELTIEAAQTIGLEQAVLLEEPQAAFYSWIEKSKGGWRDQVSVGDIILVVDVGGGTTDLSLIAVTDNDGNLELTRIAVGDHILLGGDNMDLALAYTMKAKLEKEGDRLAPWQVQALTHSCRDAKENLFSNQNLTEVSIVVSNRGSSLIGGALKTELTRDELNQVLVEGFLPQVAVSDTPLARPKGGLRTTGLPYAQDAAITRHLAAFLRKQQRATTDLPGFTVSTEHSFLHPTAVLFNGGVLKADLLIDRIMTVINSWLTAEQSPEARTLTGMELDAGVARGAAFFSYMREHSGIRIRGGTAASYYVGVESAMPAVPGMPPEVEALCIAPFGMEEGTEEIVPDDEFGLVVGEPVRFRFYSSNTRREDSVGTRLDFWSDEELEELYEIEITLSAEKHTVGEIIPVHLCAAVTDLGTLELMAISSTDKNDRWKIEFDVKTDED
ncbi:MAG TPA: Hsp70 family protein [Methylococcales bacterium]|jgi:Ethanolamine utilization protein EutJ (predicted chaperonin)|nr:Hsp70 family protein [Methylococcales bacterium]